MSATNRGSKKIEHDFYPTPAREIHKIADRIDWSKIKIAEEPCLGDGAIIEAIGDRCLGYWDKYEICQGSDYLKANRIDTDLVITNPPYSIATDIIKKSMEARGSIVMLLRMGFLASKSRKKWLQENRPSHVYVLSERPSFADVCEGYPKIKVKGCGMMYQKKDCVKICDACGGYVKSGTDATDYAWICWDRENVMIDQPGVYFV